MLTEQPISLGEAVQRFASRYTRSRDAHKREAAQTILRLMDSGNWGEIPEHFRPWTREVTRKGADNRTARYAARLRDGVIRLNESNQPTS